MPDIADRCFHWQIGSLEASHSCGATHRRSAGQPMVKLRRLPISHDAVVTLNALIRGVLDGRLTAADCRLLLCVRVTLALTATLVVRMPLPVARKIIDTLRPVMLAFRGAASEQRILWAFTAAERLSVGRGRCLARALAADALLDRAGAPHRIVIGVATPAPGILQSHAWIVRHGRVLLGGAQSVRRYVPIVDWESVR